MMVKMHSPYRNAKPGQSGEYRTGWRPKGTKRKYFEMLFSQLQVLLECYPLQLSPRTISESVSYRRKGAQHFDPVLCCERMRRVHAAEVGEAGWRVCRSPTQDVAQLRRVCVDGVPRHQELGRQMDQSITCNSAFYSKVSGGKQALTAEHSNSSVELKLGREYLKILRYLVLLEIIAKCTQL